MRFEVIPFKTAEILFKVHLTREFRSSFPPPPPRFKALKCSKELFYWLRDSNDGFSDATGERRALLRPCTVSADRGSVWDLYQHWATAGKIGWRGRVPQRTTRKQLSFEEDIEVKANCFYWQRSVYAFAQTDHVNLVNQDLVHIDIWFQENEMVAHPGKSNFMLLGSRPTLRAAIDTNIDIYRQDQRLNEVQWIFRCICR